MQASREEWRPGSFTKNYSWGPKSDGLLQLHEAINAGFDGTPDDVPREVFRERIKSLGRPDYIPLNFFLFNKTINGVDYLLVDELVFQALAFPHSKRFDYLSLFAFNLSIVGIWRAAKPYQSRPALWARHYISDRFGPVHSWQESRATANDIENFVRSDARYQAKGARKLATNLAYFYKQAGLTSLSSRRVERWWVDALFLTLDRVVQMRSMQGQTVSEDNYHSYLIGSDFFGISGQRSIEKELAAGHLVKLYKACGGRERFNDEAVRERTLVYFDDIANYAANNPNPIAAIHKSNLRIQKTIPHICALLARYAGFEVFDAEDLENLDTPEIARSNIQRAIEEIRDSGISAILNSEELMRLLRDK